MDGSDILDELKREKKARDAEFKKLSRDAQREDTGQSLRQRIKELNDKIKVMSEGTCDKRRGALETTRAISLSPFAGDITFNAKSGTKTNTSLYGTEVHATRYQYGFALTPESLRVNSRVIDVVEAVVGLSEVAGNQSRFLYDFAPDSVIFRWTDDFAPRILYGFEMDAEANLSISTILEKVANGDVAANELYIGGTIVAMLDDEAKKILEGACLHAGVKAASEVLKKRIKADLNLHSQNGSVPGQQGV